MVERSDLMGSIVTGVSFDRSRIDRVTLRTPDGRWYELMCDDGEMVCPRVISDRGAWIEVEPDVRRAINDRDAREGAI